MYNNHTKFYFTCVGDLDAILNTTNFDKAGANKNKD